MKKILLAPLTIMVLLLSFSLVSAANESMSYSGSQAAGLFTGDITCSYNLLEDEGIKSISLKAEGASIGTNYNEPDENGSYPVQAKGQFVIKGADLARLEPNNYTYQLSYVITFENGMTKTYQDSVKADASVPVISINGITDGGYYKNASFGVKAEDKNSSALYLNVSISKDGELISSEEITGGAEKKYSFKESGKYELAASVADATHKVEKSITFYVDDVPPGVKCSVSGNKKGGYDWYAGDVSILAECSDVRGLNVARIYVNEILVKEALLSKATSKSAEYSISPEWIKKNTSIDGKYNVLVKVYDLAGNEASDTAIFYADVEAPKVTLSGVAEGSFINKTPEITVVNSDMYAKNGRIYITVTKDGKEFDKRNAESESLSYSGCKEDGNYLISAKAVDAAGNESEVKMLSFLVDMKKPASSGLKLSGDKNEGYEWYNGAVNISSSLSDEGSGLKDAKISVNGKTISNETYSGEKEQTVNAAISKDWFKENESDNGQYVVKLEFSDRAGNVNTEEKTFYADVVTPKVKLSGLENGAFLKKNPSLRAEVEDNYPNLNLIRYQISLDGKAYDTYERNAESAYYMDFDKDGKYVITVTSVDKAGNISELEKISFVKDTVAPVLELSGAKEGSYTTGAKDIKATVKERNYSNCEIKAEIVKELDGKKTNIPFGNIKPDKSVYSQIKKVNGTGTYTVTLSGKDAAGNIAKPKTLTFTIDNDKPVIKITGIAKENGFTSVIAPKITVTDSYFEKKTVTLKRAVGTSVDGLKFSDSDSAKGGVRTYKNFKKDAKFDDIYTINVTAVDKAGNKSQLSQNFSVNRFGSKYSLNAYAKDREGTSNKNIEDSIIITESNVSELTSNELSIYKDGQKLDQEILATRGTDKGWQKYIYSLPKSIFSDEGIYKVNIISKDKAGNISEYAEKNKKSYSISVDRTQPVISIAGVTEGESYNANEAKAKVSVNDAIGMGSYVIEINGSPLIDSMKETEYKSDVDVKIPSGLNNEIHVMAVDAAGNQSEYTLSRITVSTNPIIRMLANVPLMIGIVIALGIMAILIVRKLKKKDMAK